MIYLVHILLLAEFLLIKSTNRVDAWYTTRLFSVDLDVLTNFLLLVNAS